MLQWRFTRIVIPVFQIRLIASIKSGTVDISPYHPHTTFRRKTRLVVENYKATNWIREQYRCVVLQQGHVYTALRAPDQGLLLRHSARLPWFCQLSKVLACEYGTLRCLQPRLPIVSFVLASREKWLSIIGDA